MKSFFWRWAPVLFWMALIFAVSAQSSRPGPQLRPYSLEDILVSKSAHLAEYAIFGFLVLRAQKPPSPRPLGKRRYLIALAVPILYAVSDEIHQRFVPGRTASSWDVVVDVAGVILALLISKYRETAGKRSM